MWYVYAVQIKFTWPIRTDNPAGRRDERRGTPGGSLARGRCAELSGTDAGLHGICDEIKNYIRKRDRIDFFYLSNQSDVRTNT